MPTHTLIRSVILSNLLLTGCLVAGSVTLAAENWTSYRGPADQGDVGNVELPLKWSESENIVWKTPLEGKAWSSPVIWGDRIYITSATEDGTQLWAECLDRNSGKGVWKKPLRQVVAPQYCHPFNSYASPSPVIEEGRLYVSFGSPFNACLDASNGNVLWERTDFVCNHFRGAGSSPFLYKDLLVLNFDGADRQYVVAMDKRTGKTVWETQRSVNFKDADAAGQLDREGDLRKAFSTPVIIEVNGKPVLISLGSMALYAYNPDDGKEIWRVELIGSHSGSPRPVIGHGLVYSPMGMGRELWAVRPDGQGVVTDTHVAWKYNRAVPSRASTLLVGDLMFMVDDGGVAACVEAKTGKEQWRQRIGGNFSASPIHANGKVYFFSQEGKTTVIAASPTYQELAANALDDGFMASPAVCDQALYLRTKSHMYRIETKR
jgi:outer membrane protein assembly factor BamB